MADRRPDRGGSTTLRGRRGECERLDRLLAGVRGGSSGVLVLRGEAGVGKTALLDYVVESAADLQVVQAAGVESEMELAFAALHQLCAPALDRLGRLPGPQRDALGTAFGLQAGAVPDRFLVGLAVLSLLSEAAGERPLVCVIDDAQWLDKASAQALAFVARRLAADPVLVLFAVREPGADLRGLPELVVEGLREADARELLASVVQGPLDERVRQRIVAETRGNALALLELPRGLSQAELAVGFGLAGALPLPGRIEQSFLRRVEGLPAETRLLLVVAAAEPVGDPALVWRAASRIGLSVESADCAEAAGLLEIGSRIRFRHPLVRSAVYRAAPLSDRQKVHAALAEATDPQVDPDRRAWHRAQATLGPDEDVAAELERSADRAQQRGGIAAAAAFLERAVGLTPDPARRAQRALAAAQAKHRAGEVGAALALLAEAEAGPPDQFQSVRVDLLRAQIAYSQNRGRDAPPLLLRAAQRLEPLDPSLARETYLDAFWAAQFAGRLVRGCGVMEVAQAALAAPVPPGPPRAFGLLLDGLATQFTEDYAAGVPMLKQAVSAFRSRKISAEEELRWLWLASHAAVVLWDDESWDVLTTRHIQLSREAGALTVLPIALTARISVHVFAGELLAAAELIEEVRTATEAIGSQLPPYGPVIVAAWKGQEAEAASLIEGTLHEVTSRGEGQGVAAAQYARAVLCNGLGRYEDALAAARLASERPEGLAFSNAGLVELAEASARIGQDECAADAVQRLSERTSASGTDWALGVEARSRALLSDGDPAEHYYHEAIDRLGRTRARAELARAHLLYGEWLRRENRRVDAREQLRTAYMMLTAMGVEAFAERARRELLATGETVRKRTVETAVALTPQEAQIARLARDGHTNSEISTQLFISTRTVEWHLGRVFGKLGISSRRQLRQALPKTGRQALLA
jgi:DNA-binding CsgD family transcriptional regulator/tetratricopeptide (TPR) repeat protein